MDAFKASRLSEGRRIVDSIHDRVYRGRGLLYEVVDEKASSCRTQRCRDYALRVYETAYDGASFGLDPFVLRQSIGLSLRHPNILKFIDADVVFKADCAALKSAECRATSVLMLTELASGNLWDWNGVRRKKASVQNTIDIAFSILCGLDYLHRRGFVHRRLHPGNVLMVERSLRDGDLEAKIGDFEDLQGSAGGSVSALPDAYVPYAAPEVLAGYEIPEATADIWSFGVLVYEMIGTSVPFPASSSLGTNKRKNVLAAIYQRLGSPSSEWRQMYTNTADTSARANDSRTFLEGEKVPSKNPLIELVNACLRLDPRERPSTSELMRHPVFAGLKPECGAAVPYCLVPPLPASKVFRATRASILQDLERDVRDGFVQFHTALLGVALLDRSHVLFPQDKLEAPEWVYSLFCACFLVAVKLLLGNEIASPKALFEHVHGIVCARDPESQQTVLMLERLVVTGLKFRFDIERVTSVPVTPTIFGTLANHPF